MLQSERYVFHVVYPDEKNEAGGFNLERKSVDKSKSDSGKKPVQTHSPRGLSVINLTEC